MRNAERDFLDPIHTCIAKGWEIRRIMCTNPRNGRTQFWWTVLPCVCDEFCQDLEGYGYTPRTALARAEAAVKEAF